MKSKTFHGVKTMSDRPLPSYLVKELEQKFGFLFRIRVFGRASFFKFVTKIYNVGFSDGAKVGVAEWKSVERKK